MKLKHWKTQLTLILKFVFSKKATKIDEIFTVDLKFSTCSKFQTKELINIKVGKIFNLALNYTFWVKMNMILQVRQQ